MHYLEINPYIFESRGFTINSNISVHRHVEKMAASEVTVAKFEKSDDLTENTSESDFCEIFSSETEFYNTLDEEDAEKLEVLLEGAYTCSPSLFKSSTSDPVERTSLLLLDKDFYSNSEYERKLSYIYIVLTMTTPIPWFRQ